MTLEELMTEAGRAELPRSQYTRTKRWLPVVDVLRAKGWGWGEIYDWLKSRGEVVQRRRHTFIASMSRRHRLWKESERSAGVDRVD